MLARLRCRLRWQQFAATGSSALQQSHPHASEAVRYASPGASENVAKRVSSSTNPAELAKFAALANEWWNPHGPFKGLHELNDARVAFIKSTAEQHMATASGPKALVGLRVLDVGCGGGIFSEALARLGADVTGIDVLKENIGVAQHHMQQDPDLHDRLRYQEVSAEALVKDEESSFDIVIASEVIEHVEQPIEFCKTLTRLCSPSGAVVVTTLNRTPKSYALAIVAAEYVLAMVPKGTHDWNKFVTPQELALMFQKADMDMTLLAGMSFHPLLRRWSLSNDSSCNYAAAFARLAYDGAWPE